MVEDGVGVREVTRRGGEEGEKKEERKSEGVPCPFIHSLEPGVIVSRTRRDDFSRLSIGLRLEGYATLVRTRAGGKRGCGD
jgi:hypothetical protein